MKKVLFCTIVSMGLIACQSTQKTSSKKSAPTADNLNKEATILWQQTSGEYDALCHQAFNIAKSRLSDISSKNPPNKMAVVIDLDETVLDNSPYNGYLVKNNKEFDRESWNRWVQMASAELVPGALDFIKHAESKGFDIYYISNRSFQNIQFTLENLQRQGINVLQDRLLLSDDGSTNKDRRRALANSQTDVVLYIGDNLADFVDVFERDMGIVERAQLVENFKKEFGRFFIILPNPMYGGWEKALEYNDPMINDEEEDVNKYKFLKSFE